MSLKLLLVGSGKMGQAMLGGWVEGDVAPADIVVIDPNADNLAVATGLGCHGYAEPSQIPEDFRPDVMVLAIKPQMMGDVLPSFRAFADAGTLVISIAAGTRIKSFEEAFGKEAAIIRVMPNTPAAIRQGVIVCCPNAKATPRHEKICSELMAAIGEGSWIHDESLMDAVTGLSGSGPAYVFYMIETMAAAGVAAGLPEDLAVRLATGTVAGAGALAKQSGESAAQLRHNVTSPNGTTAAGLEVLMAEDGLEKLMEKTVAAATRRSKELG